MLPRTKLIATVASFAAIATVAAPMAGVPLLGQDKQKAEPARQDPADVYEMEPEARFQFVHQSTANTITALRQVEAHLRKLPARELASLRRSARALIEACPYTHATFVLLAAARKTTAQSFPTVSDAKKSNPAAQKLASVRQACAVQWRICELLDVPATLEGVDTEAMIRRALATQKDNRVRLASNADLARADALLTTVKARVDALSKETQQDLQSRQLLFSQATAGLWNFKGTMIRCAADLEAAVGKPRWPQEKESSPLQRAVELLEVLRRHVALYC